MKRLILSLTLAAGIHAVLLGADLKLNAVIPTMALIPRPLTLTLVARRPERSLQPAVPEKKTESSSTTAAVPLPPEPEKKVIAKPSVRPRKLRTASKPKLKKREKPLPAPNRPALSPVSANSLSPQPTPAPAAKASAVAPPAEPLLPEPRTEAGGQNPPLRASVPEAPKAAPAVIEASPLYRVNPPPPYPLSARRRGYQGTAILEVLVGYTGRVVELRLAQSSGHAALDDAALKAVKTWSFTPGSRDDRPVDMWVRVPVRYRLR